MSNIHSCYTIDKIYSKRTIDLMSIVEGLEKFWEISQNPGISNIWICNPGFRGRRPSLTKGYVVLNFKNVV